MMWSPVWFACMHGPVSLGAQGQDLPTRCTNVRVPETKHACTSSGSGRLRERCKRSRNDPVGQLDVGPGVPACCVPFRKWWGCQQLTKGQGVSEWTTCGVKTAQTELPKSAFTT
ncbi:hypothetical protein B0J18DRAFT_233777 [Chaetomium sp. MPI-SDFR-AT-0129]|nr:hypothetical protein B0J18DRAFT_233777 [Chaetomium sp. MPI-SDFR-AT-0129]